MDFKSYMDSLRKNGGQSTTPGVGNNATGNFNFFADYIAGIKEKSAGVGNNATGNFNYFADYIAGIKEKSEREKKQREQTKQLETSFGKAVSPTITSKRGVNDGRMNFEYRNIGVEGSPINPDTGIILPKTLYDSAVTQRERQQREKEGSQIAETKAKLEAGKKHDWRNPGGENKKVDGEADSEISKRIERHKVTDPIEDFANSKKDQKKSWLSTENFGDLFMERLGDSSENKKKVIDGQTFYNDYAMQTYLDNKKRYIIENGSRQNPLFSKFSSETAQKVADEDFKKHIGADITLHNVINGHKTVGATSPYFKYSLLTKDEKDTYNYLASFTEPKKVLEYLNLIDNDLEQRKAHEVAKEIDATGSTNLKTLAVAASGFASGLESIGKASMRLNGGSSPMMNRIAYNPSYGKMLSSALIENEDSAVRKFILNVVSTVSNQAPVLAYGLYTGGAAYGFALGSQVISDSIAEAVQNNKTIESGFVYGLAQTALELSLEKLFGGIASKISGKVTSKFVFKMMSKIDDVIGNKKVASMIKKALSLSETGAGESLQEFTQAMTDPVLRNIIYNENNTYSAETLTDALYQGLIGFFAGGVMAAPTVKASVSNVQYTKIGEMSNAKNVLKLCEDVGYRHSDSYAEVKNSVEKGKTVDNATLGRLSVEVTQAIYDNTHFAEEYMATVANLGTTEQIAELMFGGNTEAAVKFKEKYSSPTTQYENGESVFNISAKEGDKDAVTKSVENVTGNHSLTEDQKKIKEVGKTFGVNIEFKNLNETITITDPKTGKKRNIVIPVEGYYDEDTNTVVLNNSGHEALRPMEYIVKHELTHSIEVDEGTYALFAKEILGSKVFVDYVTSKNNPVTSEKFKNPEEFYQYLIDHYARMGKPLGEGVKALQKARYEAIANFVGDNLFSNNSDWATTLIEEMSPKARPGFIDWVKSVIEKLKMAFRGRPELTPIEEAERRFIEAAQKAKKYHEKHDGVSKRSQNAAENKKTTTEKGDGAKYSVTTDSKNRKIVMLDRNIFKDITDLNARAEALEDWIIKNFGGKKYNTSDFFFVVMNERTAGKMKFWNENMDEVAYERKLSAAQHIDELIEISKFDRHSKNVKEKHKEFAEKGWNYFKSYFTDGKRVYQADISVAKSKDQSVVYNIGYIKDTGNFEPNNKSSYSLTGSPNKSVTIPENEASNRNSTDRISQKDNSVNSNSMQQGVKYSLSDLDAEYLSAVEKGDTETAQMMVDKVAREAGYTQRVYHGTRNFGFTRIDVSKSDDGISFFATDSTETAGTYSNSSSVRRTSDKSRTLSAEDISETKRVIADRVTDFVDYMNNTLGENDWVDNAYINSKLEESYTALENGKSVIDVCADFQAFCSEQMFTFLDNYYYKNYQGKMSEKEFYRSDECEELLEKYAEYEHEIISNFEALDRTANAGTYEMFADTSNNLVIDCNGGMWNDINSPDLPDIKSFKYRKYAKYNKHKSWSTRNVAKYAKDEGYSGVTFKNVVDSGNGANVTPATVYIFFKPQKQVKSADPVTYDDQGNVIPLSERFNRKNDDIRYSIPETSNAALLDRYENGEITREEYLDAVEGKKNKPMNPVEIANLTEEEADTTPNLPTPKMKGDGDGESKLYGSLLESGIITDDVKTEIANDTYIKNYGTTTNKAELAEAAEKLENGGAEEVKDWLSRENNISAVDVAEGIILLKQYQDAGNINGAIVVAERLREIASLSGQVVQAFSIIGRFTPEMMVAYAKHELSKARAKMVELKTEEWVEANKSRFELTDEEIRTITDNTILASELQDGSRTKAILLGEITTMLQNKLPPEKGQAMRAWMRTSLLFNVKTQLRNILGNATMVMPYIGSDFFGGLVDKAISTKTGVRTTGFDAKIFGKSFAQGMKKGAAETIDDYKRKIHTKQEELDRFETGRGGGKSFSEMHTGKLAKQLNAVARALNEVDRLNSMLLELGDRPFFESWFANELNTLMKLNKTETPTKEMVEQAKQIALQRTWQDNNRVTKAASGLRKALNFASIGGYGLGDVVLKFVKTPANIAKAMFEFSPVGFAPALIKIKEMNSAIKRGKFTPAMQKEAVRSFSNAVVGTAIYIIGYALIAAGKLDLSGGGDDDKDVSNFEKYVLGVPPYSFNFFGTRVTYTWNQPLGTVVAVVAEIMDESKKGDLDEWDVISTVGEVFTSQSFLQNLYEFFSKDDALTGLANLALSEPSAAIPTLFSQIASLTDPYRRTSYESGNMWKSALNDVIYRLPVLRQLFLDKQVNTLGEENKNPQFLNPWFAFIDPSTQYPKSSSLVAQNIYELYEKTGDKTVMPRVAPYNVTIKGKTVNFSIEERNEIQRQMGTESAEILGKMFASAEFKKLSDNEKTKAVAKVYEYAYAKMKAELDIYDYETLSQMVGTNKNGDLILSKEKYNRLSNAARQMLVDEYFFGDEEIRCKGDPQKLSDLFIKKAKK